MYGKSRILRNVSMLAGSSLMLSVPPDVVMLPSAKRVLPERSLVTVEEVVAMMSWLRAGDVLGSKVESPP